MNTYINRHVIAATFLALTTSFSFNVNAMPLTTGLTQSTVNTVNINSEQYRNFSQAELAQILSPIALYPDALLTHILIASTYPLEVVEAERWLSNHQHLSAKQKIAKLELLDWDPSVKALVSFGHILTQLSQDIGWMRNLGDAFLQQESQVLASIQTLRVQADNAGNLTSLSHVNVIRASNTITIRATNPEVIYVPYYDSRSIYGKWHWRHYPPIVWHKPIHYAHHHGHYIWHKPVHLAVGIFFGHLGWHDHRVVVHRHKSRYYKKHSSRRVTVSRQHKPVKNRPVKKYRVISNKYLKSNQRKHTSSYVTKSKKLILRDSLPKTTVTRKVVKQIKPPKKVKHFVYKQKTKSRKSTKHFHQRNTAKVTINKVRKRN